MERFAPRVRIESPYGSYDYTPEGWMWVLAFALRGVEWAIQEASKPEFRERIIASLKERRRESLRGAIEAKLDEIERLRQELLLLDAPSHHGETL